MKKFILEILITLVVIGIGGFTGYMNIELNNEIQSKVSEKEGLESSKISKIGELKKAKEEINKEQEFYKQHSDLKIIDATNDIELYEFKYQFMDILEKETHGNSKIDLDISKIKPSKTMYKIPMSISFDYLNPMFLDKYSNLQNSFFYQINSINYSSNDKRFKIEQILYGKTK